MKNRIIALCGKCAAGKDCAARILSENYGYKFFVSTTTRPMRTGESDGNPYHFITNEEFEGLIKDEKLIEYREYETTVSGKPAKWYYGGRKDDISDDYPYVIVLDLAGLRKFKRLYGKRVLAFYLNADDSERLRRCKKRGDYDKSEWDRRLISDKKDFSPENIVSSVDHVIQSVGKEETASRIQFIISSIDKQKR